MKPFAMLLLAIAGFGCSAGSSEYVYGENVVKSVFHVYSPGEGIHPDTSVLDDPENPFARSTPGAQTRWDIQSGAGAVAAFYSWATLTARQPNGENQFYTAKNLEAIFRGALAAPTDLPTVRTMAIGAYQSVLDNFPNDVTYDVTGKIAYELDTPSVQAIQNLGATARGWVLVELPDAGGGRAVRP